MKTLVNILFGHGIVVFFGVIGGMIGVVLAGVLVGSRYLVWGWMGNHGWAWVLVVITVPAFIGWLSLMNALGRSFRKSPSGNLG